MPYELTINRFGVVSGHPIVDGPVPNRSSEQVFRTFKRQCELLIKKDGFGHEELISAANRWDKWKTAAQSIQAPEDTNEPNELEIVGLAPRKNDERKSKVATDKTKWPFDAYVASLPYKKIALKVMDIDWVVRTRASLTACALQSGHRQTKLWWTIEGIPIGDLSPSEEQSAAFSRLAQAMQGDAMEALARAYDRTLSTVTGQGAKFDLKGPRLRISLADNQDNPVSELMSALYFEHKDLRAIQHDSSTELAPARIGLEELKRFASDIAGKKISVTSRSVTVNGDHPEAQGLLYTGAEKGRYASLIAGFARSSVGTGFSTRYTNLPPKQREHLIRITSPSRQLSALLADREARKLDGPTRH
jgi:hypothetical protein